MTEFHKSDLDKRILLGWQGGSPGNCAANGGAGMYRFGTAQADVAAPDYRPGYAMFKVLLAGSLLVLFASLFSWQSAQAGSMPEFGAAGHMYVSVPLNAAAPQFQGTTLQVDLMGAGVYVAGMEVAGTDTTPRFRLGKRRRNGPRASQPLPLAASEPVVVEASASPKSTLFDDLVAAYRAGRHTSR